MRCLACNIELTDYEATRKDSHGEFIDFCNTCFIASELSELSDEDIDFLKELHTQRNIYEGIKENSMP